MQPFVIHLSHFGFIFSLAFSLSFSWHIFFHDCLHPNLHDALVFKIFIFVKYFYLTKIKSKFIIKLLGIAIINQLYLKTVLPKHN